MNESKRRVIVGTRKSALAMWQTNHIVERLASAWPDLSCEIRTYVTEGDRNIGKPLPEIGGKGLFTEKLEQALYAGDIDLAVHSLKDLPVDMDPRLTLGAITSRADVRDGLLARNGWTLRTLPTGSVVGTSSIRRQAQLLAARPDLTVRPIRGNVETRVRKVLEGQYDATILASAGVTRLGLADHVTEWFSTDTMLPAPGQGALAVQCRADDDRTLALLRVLDDAMVRRSVTAERAFLQRLGGGCSAPIAACALPGDHAGDAQQPELRLVGVVGTPGGERIIRVSGTGYNAEELGRAVADEALSQGAADILRAFRASPRELPLRGKTIVITRTRRQAQELADRLVSLGATPLCVPVISIVPVDDMRPLDRAIDSIGEFDWVVFTSQNGVEIFWQRWAALGKAPRDLSHARIGAVGPATASALEIHGVTPDVVPDEFVGEEIAEAMGHVSGKRVLLPRAEIARKRLADILAERGAEVVDVPIYRTVPLDIESAAFEQMKKGVDALLFTSGSTVRNFLQAARSHDPKYEVPGRTVVACIGPVTATVAREAGMHVDVVPPQYTTQGLVESLVQQFAKGGQ
jgi:hydroxymethylbilane synthase